MRRSATTVTVVAVSFSHPPSGELVKRFAREWAAVCFFTSLAGEGSGRLIFDLLSLAYIYIEMGSRRMSGVSGVWL